MTTSSPYHFGDLVTRAKGDTRVRYRVVGVGSGSMIHIECVHAPSDLQWMVGGRQWGSWRDFDPVTEPLPPPYLVNHAAEAGITDPADFRWHFAGVVQDRPSCLVRCMHHAAKVTICETAEFSRRQMESLHAADWPVSYPPIPKPPSPVMLTGLRFADGDRIMAHHLGQCPDCGAVLWTEAK